jgi:hypothetical protein
MSLDSMYMPSNLNGPSGDFIDQKAVAHKIIWAMNRKLNINNRIKQRIIR